VGVLRRLLCEERGGGRSAIVGSVIGAAILIGGYAATQGGSEACEFPDCFPGAENTGVPDGTSLTPHSSGDFSTSSNGQVIENIDMTVGCITVNHHSVVIRNAKVQCITMGGTAVNEANPALHIYDVTIVCDTAETMKDRGVEYKNYTAERLDVSNCENGFDVNSYVTIKDSYIHDLDGPGVDPHIDGIQASWGTESTIQHNTILSWDTSAIIWGNYDTHPTVDNWTITENLMGADPGAPDSVAYILYCPAEPVTNGNVTNNHFLSEPPPNNIPGYFYTTCVEGVDGETFSGNVVHETGDPIEP
jgi:hypothetical protein